MKKSRLCIFAHFDKDDIVDDYVYFYLNELKGVADKIVFVSVSALDCKTILSLENKRIDVICRDNVGYDFYSYKTGLDAADIEQFDEVILCNDSVYGPMYDLRKIFLSMSQNNDDFWGITDSNQIGYHLQSYFLVFRKKVIESEAFLNFWNDLKVLDDKKEIIKQYEVGLSDKLMAAGFDVAVLCPVEDSVNSKIRVQHLLDDVRKSILRIFLKDFYRNFFKKIKNIGLMNPNTSILCWDYIFINKGSPFIKIELLRDNPLGLKNVDDFKVIIESKSTYPVSLIVNHLSRVRAVK